MTDIPIIFSGPMVRALLADRKTMTRRLAWRSARKGADAGGVNDRIATPWQRVKRGDRLWVRENFAHVGTCDPGFLTYQATYPGDLSAFGLENVPATLKGAGYKWTPCIHMPRALSRLTLIVTATKIERLNDISEDDAKAEGAPWYVYGHGIISDAEYALDPGYQPNKRMGFCDLWQGLHGLGSWNDNPEVVALTFRIVRANIDAPEARIAA